MGIQRRCCCRVRVGCKLGKVGCGREMVGLIRRRPKHMDLGLEQILRNRFSAVFLVANQVFASREFKTSHHQNYVITPVHKGTVELGEYISFMLEARANQCTKFVGLHCDL